MEVHVLYALELKTSKKKIPFVCLSLCLSDFGRGYNNFQRS